MALLDDLKVALENAIKQGETDLKAAKAKAVADIESAKKQIEADIDAARTAVESELKKAYVGATVLINGIKGKVEKVVKAVEGEILILEDGIRRHFTKATKK